MTKALSTDATCSAASSMSNEKLHERVCAPFRLIYRTRAELLELVGVLRDVAEAHVRTEPTGSLHLLVARRTGGRA